MTGKKLVSPSLEELSHVQVEGSSLFGLTNVSGKALALLSLASLGGGGAGVAQGLGYLGPVMGLSLSFPMGLAVLGASVVTGLLGYWLGNFDDKKIKEHNSRAAQAFRAARGTMYQKIEKGFMQAIAKVAYDPKDNTLPYDALGHAVLLSDKKIESLPPHIRVDIYRTQLDLELYRHERLTGLQTVEGRDFEKATLGDRDHSMEEKAEVYRQCRDYIRTAIREGTLSVTPVSSRSSGKRGRTFHSDADGEDVLDLASDIGEAFFRGARRTARSGGFRAGGGHYGGGGSSGSWEAAVPFRNSAAMAEGHSAHDAPAFFAAGFSIGQETGNAGLDIGDFLDSDGGSGGGGSPGFDFGDVDGDGAPVILVVAGIAAVVAASTVAGFSIWKNYISNPEMPALGNVRLSMISNSLASAEKDVRKMYAPG